MKNVLVLGVCLGVSLSAFAQEKAVSDTVKSEKKSPQFSLFNTQDIPSDFSELGRTQIITRAQIESAPVQTLSGVLSQAMGTSVQSSGPVNSFGQVYMRGGDANTVLILVDGKKMNDQLRDIYTLDNIPVSLDMIDHIEVRTGGDSKRFGEFAINGVINIVTRGSIKNNGIMASVRGGSLSSYGGEVTGAYKYKKWSLAANVSGDKASWEDQEHSNVKTFMQTNYKLLRWLDVFFDGSFVYNHYNMPFMFQRSPDAENANTYSFRANTGFKMPVSTRLNLFLTYSYSNLKEQYDPFGYRNTPLDDPYAHYYLDKVVYNRSRNAAFDLGGSYRARMVDINFGFNYNSARFMSNDIMGDLLDKWQQVPGHPYNFYKYYGMNDTWKLYYNMSLKFKKWYANAGLSLNNSTEYDNLAFMYGAEFGYNFSKKFKVFAGFDRSFRNGTFFEKYVYNDLYHGNDATDNEYVMTWNIGAKYQDDYNFFEVTAYTQSKQDAIVLQLQKNVGFYLYSNYSSEKIGIKGIEGRYRLNLEKLTSGKIPVTNLSLSYAYNESDFNDPYVLLTDNFVRHNGQAAVSVRLAKNLFLDVNFAMQKRARGYVERVAVDKTDTLGYKWQNMLDARLSWKPKNDHFQVYVQGQNLLNQKYYNTSYVPAPRASVVAGFKYNFYFRKED